MDPQQISCISLSAFHLQPCDITRKQPIKVSQLITGNALYYQRSNSINGTKKISFLIFAYLKPDIYRILYQTLNGIWQSELSERV